MLPLVLVKMVSFDLFVFNVSPNSHITALCPNLCSESVSSHFCVNVHQSLSHGERHLLPVLTLTFYGIGKCSRRV